MSCDVQFDSKRILHALLIERQVQKELLAQPHTYPFSLLLLGFVFSVCGGRGWVTEGSLCATFWGRLGFLL